MILRLFASPSTKHVTNNARHLVSLRYNSGGSSIGDMYSIEFFDNKLLMEKCEGNGYKTIRKRATLKTDHLEKELQSIIDTHKMDNWGKLKPPKEYALDAGSTAISYAYSDGKTYSYSTNYELPKNGFLAFNEIRQALEDELISKR